MVRTQYSLWNVDPHQSWLNRSIFESRLAQLFANRTILEHLHFLIPSFYAMHRITDTFLQPSGSAIDSCLPGQSHHPFSTALSSMPIHLSSFWHLFLVIRYPLIYPTCHSSRCLPKLCNSPATTEPLNYPMRLCSLIADRVVQSRGCHTLCHIRGMEG